MTAATPRRRRLGGRALTASVLVIAALLIVAFAGPFAAPFDYDAPVGPAGNPPSWDHLFGTDALGRDVLSRVLHGGITVMGLGVAATILSYVPGVLIGLAAGFRKNHAGLLLIAGVDVLLALPSIVLMLVVMASLGANLATLLISVVLVQLPPIARLVSTTTAEVSTAGYVDVALCRGESVAGILVREVLPNVVHVIFADVGVRFGWSITLIASMNYLGLGLPPPTADWGLMIAENREFIGPNPWAVLVPAALLATLTIAVSAFLDTYTVERGRSIR